jgi:hypothetical protein
MLNVYSFKLVGFDDRHVGVKGAGVYCLVKVLCYIQRIKLPCKSFYCGDSDLSGYHFILGGYCGQMPE